MSVILSLKTRRRNNILRNMRAWQFTVLDSVDRTFLAAVFHFNFNLDISRICPVSCLSAHNLLRIIMKHLFNPLKKLIFNLMYTYEQLFTSLKMDLLENSRQLKDIQTLSLKRLHLEGQELRFWI